MKKIPIIPECYKDLPDNTNLSSKEVAKMFGYKNQICLSAAEKRHLIPARDKELFTDCAASSTVMLKMSKYWKLGTIRKWKNDNSI